MTANASLEGTGATRSVLLNTLLLILEKNKVIRAQFTARLKMRPDPIELRQSVLRRQVGHVKT